MPGAHRVAPPGRGKVYWYAYRGGPQIWAGRIEDEAGAAAAIQTAWSEEIRIKPVQGSVGRLIHDYRLSADFRQLARSTKDLYHLFLGQAEARLGHLSKAEYASGEARRIIREWRTQVAARSPRSADQIKSVLGAFTSWCRREDHFTSDVQPTADMVNLYTAPPKHAWKSGEVASAIFLLPSHLGDVVRFTLQTGLRREDLTKIAWAAIDEQAGLIRYHTSKGRKHGRMVLIRLTPALKATLRRIRARGPIDIGPILRNSYGAPWQASGLATSMAAALNALGVTKRLHGLRRTAATHLAAEGLSSREIAKQLGWSESEAEAMSAIYVDEEEALAVNTRVNM